MNEGQDYDYDKRNTSVIIGTAYPKEAHEFIPGFCEIHVAQSSFLHSVLWIIICPLSFGHYMGQSDIYLTKEFKFRF
jgi:hypothetical protein